MERTIPLAEAMTEEQKQNLWNKVDKRGPDECWPWSGGFGNKGQPLIYMRLASIGQGGGTKWNAARVVYLLLVPGAPEAHIKGVSPCKRDVNCVNPDHVRPIYYNTPVVRPDEVKHIEAVKRSLESWHREGRRIREQRIAWTRKGSDGQPQSQYSLSS